MNMDRISFGIGCFHFGFQPQAGKTFKGEDYIIALEKTLSTISNIETIEIEAEEDFRSREFELDPDEPHFQFQQSDLLIRLSIFIPERVQSDIDPKFSIIQTCERFIVDVNPSYFFQITTVRPVNPPSDFMPSDGVFLCRKFLEKFLGHPRDAGVCFQSLGPSPFHADFFLEQGESGTGRKLVFERVPSRGYDYCYFRYDGDCFADIEEVYQAVIDELGDQIGLFFLITHTRVLRDRDWSNLYNLIQKIISNQKRKGFWAYWKNTLTSDHPLHDAMLSLAQIEIMDLDNHYNLQQDLREFYVGDRPPELLSFLEGAIAEFSSIPFRQMRDILSLLESKKDQEDRTCNDGFIGHLRWCHRRNADTPFEVV